jgi:hypothetical protein
MEVLQAAGPSESAKPEELAVKEVCLMEERLSKGKRS